MDSLGLSTSKKRQNTNFCIKKRLIATVLWDAGLAYLIEYGKMMSYRFSDISLNTYFRFHLIIQ